MASYTDFDVDEWQEHFDILNEVIPLDSWNQVDDVNPGIGAVDRSAESAAPARTAAAPLSEGPLPPVGEPQIEDFPLMAQDIAFDGNRVFQNPADDYLHSSPVPPQNWPQHANSFAHGAGFQVAADQRVPRAPSAFVPTDRQAYGGMMGQLGIPPPATPPYMPPQSPAFTQGAGVTYNFGRDVVPQHVPCRLVPSSLRSLQYDEQAAVAGPSTGGLGAPRRTLMAPGLPYVSVLPPAHEQMMPQPPFPLAHQAQPMTFAPNEQPDGAEQAPAQKGSGHCLHCGKFFKDVRSHTRNCKVTQADKPKLECPHQDCESTFVHSKDLARHLEAKHDKKVFKCDEPCSYQCNRADNLRRHKQSKACHRARTPGAA
ncbi:Putative Zinc finger C2H2-type [Septoria linicola]|uniref:Zinc finger C2H2-type n=1 Tax=Septoria linicola TaxID=215465 RepID=A0A9Q9AXV6_9PEZI|nr:putative Zinc finger C2H2-type [Septoria linicola]USW54073.1 Putative Zinc finger C2H2-type [Septoria linicola]